MNKKIKINKLMKANKIKIKTTTNQPDPVLTSKDSSLDRNKKQ